MFIADPILMLLCPRCRARSWDADMRWQQDSKSFTQRNPGIGAQISQIGPSLSPRGGLFRPVWPIAHRDQQTPSGSIPILSLTAL